MGGWVSDEWAAVCGKGSGKAFCCSLMWCGGEVEKPLVALYVTHQPTHPPTPSALGFLSKQHAAVQSLAGFSFVAGSAFLFHLLGGKKILLNLIKGNRMLYILTEYVLSLLPTLPTYPPNP